MNKHHHKPFKLLSHISPTLHNPNMNRTSPFGYLSLPQTQHRNMEPKERNALCIREVTCSITSSGKKVKITLINFPFKEENRNA